MEYLDSRKNPLREGLYRDRGDKSYVFYLFQKDGKWRFQRPDDEITPEFPLTMARDIEPIHEPMVEIEKFRAITGFLEKKVEEEVEERRNL